MALNLRDQLATDTPVPDPHSFRGIVTAGRPGRLMGWVVALILIGVGAIGAYRYVDGYVVNRGFGAEVTHQPPDKRGQIVQMDLNSPAIGGRLAPVYVYLPAAYRHDPHRRFPVIYLLHGMPGSAWNAFHHVFHFESTLDDLIASHAIPPVIAVAPSGNWGWFDLESEWANGPFPDQQWDTFLYRDVVGAVDANFRTVPQRRARAVAGYSAGANAAMNELVLHDMFGVAATWSADFFQAPDSVNYQASIVDRYSAIKTLPAALGRLAHQQVAVMMTVGSDDAAVRNNKIIAGWLQARHITHRLVVFPEAGHSWKVWVSGWRASLIWIARHLAPS